MNRPLYAVCPSCGNKAAVRKFSWNGEEEETHAVIRCICGRYQVPYSVSRVLPVDLCNPYMPEEHFDLLIPAEWDRDLWNRISRCLPGLDVQEAGRRRA